MHRYLALTAFVFTLAIAGPQTRADNPLGLLADATPARPPVELALLTADPTPARPAAKPTAPVFIVPTDRADKSLPQPLAEAAACECAAGQCAAGQCAAGCANGQCSPAATRRGRQACSDGACSVERKAAVYGGCSDGSCGSSGRMRRGLFRRRR